MNSIFTLWTAGSIYKKYRGALGKLTIERVSSIFDRWIQMDGPDLIQREKEKIAGRLQLTDGGAMAGLSPSSPEFDETASPTTI
jgi:hypothetical protein